MHTMLFGGSRSGKTFLLVRAVVTRALAHESRHLITRFRFNHIKGSIIYDTLPKVMKLCFPGVADHCKLNKEDWFYTLPNGSEIWFGGLDDKERTEKILGQEYATVMFNECSQIPRASKDMALTRLAQKTELRLKAYYDCNPPSDAHWTCKQFIQKKSPEDNRPLPNPQDYASLLMNPKDNEQNLAPEYLATLDNLPARMRARFRDGKFVKAQDNALWSIEDIENCRLLDTPPDMRRIIIAVDPSGCSGPEDSRSDEIGIIVVGLGADGRGYIMEDLSGRYSPNEWGKAAITAYDRHMADCIVAETNFGGDMVRAVIKSAASDLNHQPVPFKKVTASRGKAVRAEPVSTLFEQGKVWLVGYFPHLEEQMAGMTTAGYMGEKSPDRVDAMVWGVTELFPSIVKRDKKPEQTEPMRLASGSGAWMA
jgi:predicted phage terminase large subunit-like protein